MRNRLLLLIFSILFQYCQSSGLEYKFVVVEGEPIVLNSSDIIPVKSFDECIKHCETETSCVLAYQANSSDPCHLFEWNSILEVKKNESGGVGTVAFKVYTDQPACDLNRDLLLNGKTYPVYPNDTTQYLWRIDTSEDGWTITYVESNVDANIRCGNWAFNRPYRDGCESECNVTLVQVYAKFGPLTKYGPWLGSEMASTDPLLQGATKNASSWNECMQKCYDDARCAAAYYYKEENKCKMAFTGFFWFLERTSASDGHQMVIKLPMSEKTCKMTTEELLNDQYYPVWPAMVHVRRRQYFSVRTTPKYYVFNSYYYQSYAVLYKINIAVDETIFHSNWFNGCPLYNQHSTDIDDYIFINETVMCYRFDREPGLTQIQAKELCALMEQKLMTDKYRGTMPVIAAQYNDNNVIRRNPVIPYFEFIGITGFASNDTGKVWYGLEKDATDGKWKWADPSFVQFDEDVMPIVWGPGEPKEGPDMNCAYMEWGDSIQNEYKYEFHAALCNSTTTDGLACGSRQAPYLGIKTYADVAAEFGGPQPCPNNTCPAVGPEENKDRYVDSLYPE